MNGEDEINKAVAEILDSHKDSKFRVWKQRLRNSKLSLELKLSIIEYYTPNEIVITIKPQTYEKQQTSGYLSPNF
jgi:hypothetical protein